MKWIDAGDATNSHLESSLVGVNCYTKSFSRNELAELKIAAKICIYYWNLVHDVFKFLIFDGYTHKEYARDYCFVNSMRMNKLSLHLFNLLTNKISLYEASEVVKLKNFVCYFAFYSLCSNFAKCKK